MEIQIGPPISLSEAQARALVRALKGVAAPQPDAEISIRRLKDHFADYQKKHVFKPGDIVRLKPGLEAISDDLKGKPCIVVEVLSNPPMGDCRGAEQGATLDLRIGALAPSGAFAMALFESAIFEPWPMNGT